MPIIKIHREAGIIDLWRIYNVEIDGEKVGNIKNGLSTEYSVSEGKHVIQLKSEGSSRSNKLEVDTASKQEIELRCGNTSKGGWRVLLEFLGFPFRGKEFLWIKEQ